MEDDLIIQDELGAGCLDTVLVVEVKDSNKFVYD